MRSSSLPHFTRQADGWWFDFQLTVRQTKKELEILAYAFELRAPPEDDGAPFEFVRFDLNGPGHDNDGRGLRSHLHLSSDEDGFSVPAPIMTPFELLDLFVFGIGGDGRGRHPTGGSPLPSSDEDGAGA